MFPNEIKFAMRECILSLLWSRDDIVQFFRDNGCTPTDIRKIGNHKEMPRCKVVDSMFNVLTQRPDDGLGQFRAMLKDLCEWKTFDPYYFDTLKKLDRTKAKSAIAHLAQVQRIWDDKIKRERAIRAEREASQRARIRGIKQIREEFLDLYQGKIDAQKRGYRLESILGELASLSDLEVTDPFRSNGEQIDGAIKYDGEHYIIEAKWQDQAATNEPVYQFAGKVEGKMYGRGLFISINGFSYNVISGLVNGKAIKTVFIDAEDIIFILEELITFKSMLDSKIKAAQTKGLIYVNPMTGKNKV